MLFQLIPKEVDLDEDRALFRPINFFHINPGNYFLMCLVLSEYYKPLCSGLVADKPLNAFTFWIVYQHLNNTTPSKQRQGFKIRQFSVSVLTKPQIIPQK